MSGEPQPRQCNPVLRYFGFETGQRAWEAFVWALPFLLLLAAGLFGISFAVHWLFPLPLVVYAVAIGLALVYFFFFLARVRTVAEGVRGPDDSRDPNG